jgi:hypothetical protein
MQFHLLFGNLGWRTLAMREIFPENLEIYISDLRSKTLLGSFGGMSDVILVVREGDRRKTGRGVCLHGRYGIFELVKV